MISEFSKIAAEFIKKGTNTKMYQAASRKIDSTSTYNFDSNDFSTHLNSNEVYCTLFMIIFVEKLGVDAETVKNAVEGLMYLFTESSRHMVCG